jgi:hypothetical protein
MRDWRDAKIFARFNSSPSNSRLYKKLQTKLYKDIPIFPNINGSYKIYCIPSIAEDDVVNT